MNLPSSTITPLSTEQQQQVVNQTHAYLKKASELFNIKSKSLEINFDLKGRSAGMYRTSFQNKRFFARPKREIRYNPHIFSKYFDDNFTTTIPHEVAHYVTDIIYGLKNIKPHGNEWKAVMRAFDADASVTANYDLSGIPLRKQSLYTYQCTCREHQLSTIRHNKISRRRFQYYCKSCKQPLKIKQQEATPG